MKMFLTFLLALFAACYGGSAVIADEETQLQFFETRIRPVLVKHCYRCHSAEAGKSKGGLLLDSRSGWQVGGDSGPAIIPHKPDESPVVLAINHSGEMSEMPPTSRLSKQIVSDFEKWIADGALDPREGSVRVSEAATMDIEEGRKFWAFQPRRTFSEARSIDDFVKPEAPQAAANKLVRRLFLDLIGLPPTPEERAEFLRMYSQQSPAEAVDYFADQLLSRRQFGEKWARHWLDVARYADSNGGDFNLTFPEAWRYRNYVIDAFNDDMPYDQFLREQIAGDLMPAETTEQRNRQLIATGFLMVAPKMLTERNKPKMHLDIADEQLDTIGRATMGLTLGCARCHDHKFDPIPTSDYYAMLGILHSTRTADGILMGNVNVSGWAETDLAIGKKTKALIAAHDTRVAELDSMIKQKKKLNDASPESVGIVVDDTEAKLTGPWRKSTLRPNHIGDNYLATDKGKGPYSILWKATLPKPGKYEVRVSFGGGGGLAKTAPYVVRHADGETRLVINQTVQPTIQGLWFPLGQFTFGTANNFFAEVLLSDEDAGGAVIADAVQFVHVDDLAKDAESGMPLSTEIKALESELKKLKDNAIKIPKAMAAKDHDNERLGDLRIRIRGETQNLGANAPRGFLQVVNTVSNIETIPDGESGRLQLADWLTHADHPLTARVMVNRIWQQLFGQGIVATSDNFGTRGVKPAHPELLDYLAENFVASGWSVKTLIREIIASQAYQQSVQATSNDDPDNLLLRSQNRRPAPAETLRDSMLAIAGELDLERRESVVEQLGMYAIATSGKRHQSLGETGQLRQRSIYMPVVRGAVPPSLAIFDLPNPDLVTGRRAATTVPAQALFMMNSPFVRDMAQAVSLQVVKMEVPDEQILQKLYQRVLIREADSDDIEMGMAYITRLMDEESKSRQEAAASFVQILFSSTEFRFIE